VKISAIRGCPAPQQTCFIADETVRSSLAPLASVKIGPGSAGKPGHVRYRQVLTFQSLCYTFRITIRLEWDSEKNRINQANSGIAAALVFDGPVEGAVLLVVHAYRMDNKNGEEETIRIISAREANKRERRIYVQQAVE